MTSKHVTVVRSILAGCAIAAMPMLGGPLLSPGGAFALAAAGGNGGEHENNAGGNGGGNAGGNAGSNAGGNGGSSAGSNAGTNSNAGHNAGSNAGTNSNAGHNAGQAVDHDVKGKGDADRGTKGLAGTGHEKAASTGQMSHALGALNAAHASPAALAHAAPGSKVGQIASYDRAMLAALAMPAITPAQIAARTAAIGSARTQLALASNKELTPAVVAKVDFDLALPATDPTIGVTP